jgi:hypothetical protein
MNEKMQYIVDMIIDGDDDDIKEIEEAILMESEEDKIIRTLGDTTFMNYIMKFEEYLDDHDIYLFDGWETAKFIGRPKIDKFWTEFNLWVSPETDLRGAMRLKNDKEGQNRILVKDLGETGKILKFKILKRYLDAVEERSKERAEQLSDEQVTKMSPAVT